MKPSCGVVADQHGPVFLIGHITPDMPLSFEWTKPQTRANSSLMESTGCLHFFGLIVIYSRRSSEAEKEIST